MQGPSRQHIGVSIFDEITDSTSNTETMDVGIQNQGGVFPPLRGKPTLAQVIAHFKYQSTKEMNALDNKGVITKFRQRNYYERIIRNEKRIETENGLHFG